MALNGEYLTVTLDLRVETYIVFANKTDKTIMNRPTPMIFY